MPTLKKQVLKYTLLPGFLPRIHRVFTSGFSHISYLIAVIYRLVNLLPYDHPYLKPENIGRYGIKQVIAEAANNLVIKKQNIDQIIIFFSILIGVVLLMAQFALLIIALFTQQQVMAMGLDPDDFFFISSTYNAGPDQDLAFIILDKVFGIQEIFESCISTTGVPCFDLDGNIIPTPTTYPYPIHIALHQLLRFYSLGIFAVGVLVFLYLLASVIGEMASSGTPFGQRLNKTWAPVRLILFFALLLPMNIGGRNEGLNAAQIITFWVAKGGSNFATNAWGFFNDRLTTSYLGQTNKLIASPNIPEINTLIGFVFLAKVCKIAEEFAYNGHLPNGVQAYVVRAKQSYTVQPGVDALELNATNFETAFKHANYGNILIRFGVLDPAKYDQEKAMVAPLCGQIKVKTTTIDAGGNVTSGAALIQEEYYNIIRDMWDDVTMSSYAECLVKMNYKKYEDPNCLPILNNAFAESRIEAFRNIINTKIPARIALQQTTSTADLNIPATLHEKGWAGAAIWYNRIAEVNGAVTGAILNIPTPDKYPWVMETIAAKRRMVNEHGLPSNKYDPVLAQGIEVDYTRDEDEYIAIPMAKAYRFWNMGEVESDNSNDITGNIVIDTINMMFGTSGIFEMRKNTDIHPLAQLSTLGKSMMTASVQNLAFAGGTKLGQMFNKGWTGELSGIASGFFFKISFMTLSMSFVLYYVLPFLPFIYFLFAVSGWIKSIFEAIVAMPLWALAHLKIDGEGVPGPWATNGYYLLMEIFLRPILIVFGLIASISIFSALVETLNQIFDLLITNLGGTDVKEIIADPTLLDFVRGPVDQFFYTMMYVIICYMIGMSSFKLIDLIPQSILRWMNVSVKTFQESDKNAGEQIIQQAYRGASLASREIEGAPIRGGQAAILLSH